MLFSRRHPIRDDELNAYVDGELAAGRRARVEAHLEGCAACRETVSSLRSLRGALGALPRAERQRSFVVREADVARRAARPASGFAPAAQLLSGVTIMAVLAFAALVSLDAAGGDASKGGRSASTVQVLPQDSGQPGTRNNFSSESPTTKGQDQQVTALPATGPLPEATENAEQPPSSPLTKPTAVPQDHPGAQETAPGIEPNAATEATPPTLAGAPDATAQPPSEPLPSVVGGGQAPSAGDTQTLEGSAATDQTPPPSFDAATNGQGVIPPAVPTTAQSVDLKAAQSGGSDTGLRVGEGTAAAVALLAGGSLAFVWWRRRPL